MTSEVAEIINTQDDPPEPGRVEPSRASVSVETLLYAGLLVTAVWLRFANLGWLPLSELEARQALAAVFGGPAAANVASSPAYQTLTGLAFTLSGESEAAARWAPALAGVALAMTPLMLRRIVGHGVAFVAAALMVFSPILWTASREATGATLAALGVVGAMYLLMGGHLLWSAVLIGVALVSGPSALTGLATVGAGVAVFAVIRRRRSNPTIALAYPFPTDLPSEVWLRSLAIGGLVALALATGIGFFPEALSGAFDGLGTWASGWFQSSGVAAATLLLALVAYEPLVALIGGIGLVNGLRRGTNLEAWFAAWGLGSLVVLLLYRGRYPSDLVWTVLPLTILAAQGIVRLVGRILDSVDAWVVLAFTGAIVALAAFAYLGLRGSVGGLDSFQMLLGVSTHLLAALMGVALAGLALLLLAMGWSRTTAASVAGAASLLVLAVLTVSAGATLNFGDSAPSARELWRPRAGTLGLHTLRESLHTLSKAETGQLHSLPLHVRDAPPAGLEWALRGFSRIPSDASPPVILVREGAVLPGEYLGQSVTVEEKWGWNGWLPPDPLAWWLNRELPTLSDRWVLLVRKDVAGVEELIPVEFDPGA